MLLNDGETDGSFGGLAFSSHSEVYLCLDVETDLHFANLIQKWRRSGVGNFDFKMPDDEWATGDWEREEAATGGPLEGLSDAKALVLLIGEYTRRQTPRVDLSYGRRCNSMSRLMQLISMIHGGKITYARA